jgi:hypothetical protein
MTHKTADRAKGRVRGAADAPSGNRSPKNTGRVDQADGSAASNADKVADIQRST